jgi:hypothetical protein
VAVRARMETLIAQRNPVFVFPEEMRLNTKG